MKQLFSPAPECVPQRTTHNAQPTTHNPQPTTHNPDRRIKKITQLLAENLAYPWQVPELAATVKLSDRQLQRLFKAETQCCPLRYLRRLRLEKARELLRTTDDTIGEIAASVGINDCSHFVRDFAHAQGVSPTEYRKASAESSYDVGFRQ